MCCMFCDSYSCNLCFWRTHIQLLCKDVRVETNVQSWHIHLPKVHKGCQGCRLMDLDDIPKNFVGEVLKTSFSYFVAYH
jgi:hypothetical protein